MKNPTKVITLLVVVLTSLLYACNNAPEPQNRFAQLVEGNIFNTLVLDLQRPAAKALYFNKSTMQVEVYQNNEILYKAPYKFDGLRLLVSDVEVEVLNGTSLNDTYTLKSEISDFNGTFVTYLKEDVLINRIKQGETIYLQSSNNSRNGILFQNGTMRVITSNVATEEIQFEMQFNTLVSTLDFRLMGVFKIKSNLLTAKIVAQNGAFKVMHSNGIIENGLYKEVPFTPAQ